jgi:CubicO group peptidase (beta-lactamase class C family)
LIFFHLAKTLPTLDPMLTGRIFRQLSLFTSSIIITMPALPALSTFWSIALLLARVTATPASSLPLHHRTDTIINHCSLPGPGEDFQTASAAEMNLDPDAIKEAIEYAATAGRISVQIFRHNCKVAEGPLDSLTDGIPNNVFSVTKSVVAMIAGLAYDRKLLALDDPIGKYLPMGPGWGDKAHRAITVEQLLTEASGLDEAVFSEIATGGLDDSAPREALAQPFKYPPGTKFDYSQRVPDLMSFIIQRAVGEDLQTFAQRHLFDPIGIANDTFFWLRDRSGNTYGFASLYIPPTQLAKLGLVMQNAGSWNDQQVISSDWVSKVSQSSGTNPCYGYFFWTNRAKPCIGVNLPSAQTYDRHFIPTAPFDLYAMAGAVLQNNFMIPSLDMTVTWTGILGDSEPNLSALLDAAPGADRFYTFFRILMRGVKDVDVPDPGPFKVDPLDLDINPDNYLSPSVLLNDIVPSPDCNIIFCNGGIPSEGVMENLREVVNVLMGSLKKSLLS